MTTKQQSNEIVITRDKITLRFGHMEPVVIHRARLRTRLQLVEWVYRLSGWPGMSVNSLRSLIASVFRVHGWALPAREENVFGIESSHAGLPGPNPPRARPMTPFPSSRSLSSSQTRFRTSSWAMSPTPDAHATSSWADLRHALSRWEGEGGAVPKPQPMARNASARGTLAAERL